MGGKDLSHFGSVSSVKDGDDCKVADGPLVGVCAAGSEIRSIGATCICGITDVERRYSLSMPVPRASQVWRLCCMFDRACRPKILSLAF